MIDLDQQGKIRDYVVDKPVELIYLFGSQATDSAGPLSDYDFGVLFDAGLTKKERSTLKLDLINFFMSVVHQDRVDVVDLNASGPAFRFSVFAEGKVMYLKNKQTLIFFETSAMSDYVDFHYRYHQLASEELTRLARS